MCYVVNNFVYIFIESKRFVCYSRIRKGEITMFFADFTPKYYLVDADYNENNGLSIQEKSKIVIKNYRKEIKDYCLKEGMTPPVTAANDNYYIILWRNLSKTNIDDNTEDTLINEMCKSINQYGNELFDIYIKDLNTLADSSIEKFIRRLCLIKKYTNKKPIFLDNTTSTLLAPKYVSDSKEDMETLAKQTFMATMEYDNLIGFLENLYSSIIGSGIETETKGFIYYYFEWQIGNITAETACKELDNMSKRTFYKYAAEFEAHPLYSEHCKLHLSDMLDKEKKGPVTVDLQEFYSEVASLFVEKTIDINVLNEIDTVDICKKYSLASTLEVYRILLTAKKKLKIK